jgi:transcriptional regulator with XRE-family HTH domain
MFTETCLIPRFLAVSHDSSKLRMPYAFLLTFLLTSTGHIPQITQEIGTLTVKVPGSCPLWQLPPQMATTLAPVDSREVVRCDRCLLVQFRTSNNLCRRCHLCLDEEEPEVVQAPTPQLVPAAHRGHLNLAASIRAMRLRNGLSQRQLAGRMSVPRTYVSKIENEKATPTLSSLERLARALEVSVPDLLSGGERNRQEEISELMKDPFIAEMMPFVSSLNGMQMSSILTQIRDLTTRPRRSA